MKSWIRHAVVLGALAVSGLAMGAGSASANCIGAGGGTDCPLTPGVPLFAQPYVDRGVGTQPVPDAGRVYREPRRWDRQRRHGGWRNGPVYIDRAVPVYRYSEPRYYYEDEYYEPRRYRARSLSAAHVDWCYDRYRTYRASDNTYKPTKNSRRQCVSPYS